MTSNESKSWIAIEEIKALVKEKYPSTCLARIEMWDRWGISKYKVKGTFHAWFRKMWPKPAVSGEVDKL